MNNRFNPNKRLPYVCWKLQELKKEQNNKKLGYVKSKFNFFSISICILFLLLILTCIDNNYSFAHIGEEDKKINSNFEKNENPIDVVDIISQNINGIIEKEIFTEEKLIERDVKYIYNNQLPKDEEIVIEEGFDGKKEVTYIRSFENNEITDEKIVNEHVILEPSKRVIHKGTSEYLRDNKVHIGDIMYTLSEVYMMDEPNDEANIPCKIYQYIDVKLEEVLEGWCKVFVDGFEGYVKSESLTSAEIMPDIVEKCRIQRIMVSVKFDMNLNKKSGLTKADFLKILSGNSQDVNKIFETNAGLFYELEQKFNVNGVLLASIGIHESAWGTSKIANEKKNLFGYGAYDSSPYESAVTFETYEHGIELLAKVLSKYYLNEAGTKIYDNEKAVGSFYNGPTVSGINVRYASDPEWANKVFNTMEMLYKRLK